MTEDTPSTWLTPGEVEHLSGKVRSSAQSRALTAKEITHEVRADGLVLVLRSYIEQRFGGVPEARRARERKPAEPNWGAIL